MSEDRFADFAELAVNSPREEAVAALDVLFDKLKGDQVAYYIYSEWMEGAFYNLLSPCRSAPLFTHAVDRMVSDGIMTMDECRPYVSKREWISMNLKGSEAVVPGVVLDGTPTLVLVLDLSCPSCREAISKLGSSAEWKSYRHVAVCCGMGQDLAASGWEFVRPEGADSVFDIHLTPIYFTVSSSGKVDQPYTLVL